MTNRGETSQEWWQAVRFIAGLVSRDGITPNEDSLIRRELNEQGFSSDGIGKALDWVDQAALSGNLIEALGMLQPETESVRIDHPLERASLSDELWGAITECRRRGLFSPDVAERLIEGVRALDPRDWDSEEVGFFMEELLMATFPGLIGHQMASFLVAKPRGRQH